MFREVYKKANDEIKGDRQILDKAFEMAQMPEKKPIPILRYSFVGTAVAAVIVLGAIFTNSEIFMQKTIDVPSGNELGEATTKVQDKSVEAVAVEKETEAFVLPISEDTEEEKKPEAKKKITGNGKTEEVVTPDENSVVNDAVVAAEEDIMVLSDEAPEVASFSTWGIQREEIPTELVEEDSEDWDYDSDEDDSVVLSYTAPGNDNTTNKSGGSASNHYSEEAETEEVMIFSYMQAVTSYEEHEIISEGFVNTDVSPVANEAEAIERADNEFGMQYSHTQVFYDPVEKIWQVSFKLSGPDGGNIVVYLNDDGITQMIVYPGYYFGE